MKVIDLSHSIHSNMPYYPGTEPPILEDANKIEIDGFAEKKLTFYSHTGTHIDAPAHMLKEGQVLDNYDIGYFVGKAGVIDLGDMNTYKITKEALEEYEDYISSLEYLILKTGWDKYWGEENYFNNYPVLTTKAIKWLNDNFNLKGIGVDTISVDEVNSSRFPIHYEILGSGKIIIENLTNLDILVNKKFILSCAPFKIVKADGSPVRAIAILDYKR